MKVIKWKYKPSGNCPVQSKGYFLNYFFYFRSRWDKTSIEFSKTEKEWKEDNIIWADYDLYTTEMYQAGYLPEWKCRLLIYCGCFRFLLYLLYDKAKEKIMQMWM